MSAFTPSAIVGGVRFAIHVQPRARRPGVDGTHGAALRVRVGAAPVDGAANEAVVDLLAESLGVPKRNVTIVSGHNARAKVVEVTGVSVADVLGIA